MNTKTKSMYELARNLPIAEVVKMLGGEPDKSNKGKCKKYHVGGKTIIVSGTGFGWFEGGGISGAGAIDLTMLLKGCDTRSALNWLLDLPLPSASQKFSFPTSGVGDGSADAASELAGKSDCVAVASAIPEMVPENWQRVRSWLLDVRGLDALIIDKLHDDGDIFADSYANAIFIGRAGGSVSCEVRGTGSKKFAGRRGGGGLFVLDGGLNFRGGAVVESAIDAISLRMLGNNGKIVSTGGALGNNAIDYLRTLPGSLLAAFDSDEAGDGYSERLIVAMQNTSRIRAGYDLKDWNDLLLAEKGLSKIIDTPFSDAELKAAGATIYPARPSVR